MAKSLLQMKTKKKPRKTQSEVFLVNRKYLGDEPTVKTKVDVAMAFNWYHNMCDKADARQYLKDYFKGDKAACKNIDRIPDSRIPYTAAWLCRIVNNQKRDLSESEWVYVNNSIQDATRAQPEEEEVEAPVKVERSSIQDRMKEKLSDIIGEIEALVDSGDVDLYEWLKKNEVPAAYAPRIADYYRPIETEFRLAMVPKGQDGHRDGYENWSKAELRARAEFYGKIVSDAERYGEVTKKTRAPRKARPMSMDKLLRNLKYLKESNEYKVASINPVGIVGAQELWVFNTNSMVLGVYRAVDRGGLSVKGSAVTNWDEKASVYKKVGRNPEASIKRVLDGGKLVLRKVMDEIKSKAAVPNGRINNHMILLRAIK